MINRVSWSQKINLNGKEIHISVDEEGTVVIFGATRVQARFPYRKDALGFIEHDPLPDEPDPTTYVALESDTIRDEFCVKLGMAPEASWDLEVELWDRGNLLKRTHPAVMVVDSQGDPDAEDPEPQIFAQNGVLVWTQQAEIK